VAHACARPILTLAMSKAQYMFLRSSVTSAYSCLSSVGFDGRRAWTRFIRALTPRTELGPMHPHLTRSFTNLPDEWT